MCRRSWGLGGRDERAGDFDFDLLLRIGFALVGEIEEHVCLVVCIFPSFNLPGPPGIPSKICISKSAVTSMIIDACLNIGICR
jgi:hypothetical protein